MFASRITEASPSFRRAPGARARLYPIKPNDTHSRFAGDSARQMAAIEPCPSVRCTRSSKFANRTADLRPTYYEYGLSRFPLPPGDFSCHDYRCSWSPILRATGSFPTRQFPCDWRWAWVCLPVPIPHLRPGICLFLLHARLPKFSPQSDIFFNVMTPSRRRWSGACNMGRRCRS